MGAYITMARGRITKPLFSMTRAEIWSLEFMGVAVSLPEAARLFYRRGSLEGAAQRL